MIRTLDFFDLCHAMRANTPVSVEVKGENPLKYDSCRILSISLEDGSGHNYVVLVNTNSGHGLRIFWRDDYTAANFFWKG